MVSNRAPGEIWMVLKDRKMLGRLIVLQDWTIRGLARESGFQSHSYLNRLVLGQVKTCSAERAVAICANLQVPVDSLFLTKMSTDSEHSSGARFQPGTAAGGRTQVASETPRRSRRAALTEAKTA